MKNARRVCQSIFLLLTLAGVFLLRCNAEAWCPFGGVEAIYTYVAEGNMLCSLAISNFYVLAAVILTALAVRRAFCGYLCPIGTILEWLGIIGRRTGVGRPQAPRKLDHALALGKYVVLAAVLIVTWRAGELAFRGYCPAYALLGRHGADITHWAYVVTAAIVVASILTTMPFCRWFCPLAAVMNPFSRFGIGRIKRDAESCTSCGRCAASCPMCIPVDRLREVTVSRCTACMQCIEACPQKTRNTMIWGPPGRFGKAWPRSVVIVVLILCATAAVTAAHLAPLPSFLKNRGPTPKQIATLDLRIQGLTCRGRANLMVGFLERDDMYKIHAELPGASGYYKLEAWPDPTTALVRINYDPTCADEETIKRAIVEPYYDMAADRWWLSPFIIEGYATPGLEN